MCGPALGGKLKKRNYLRTTKHTQTPVTWSRWKAPPATLSFGGVVSTRREIPLGEQKLTPPVLVCLSSICLSICCFMDYHSQWGGLQRSAKSSCDFLHLQNCEGAQGRMPHPLCLAAPVITGEHHHLLVHLLQWPSNELTSDGWVREMGEHPTSLHIRWTSVLDGVKMWNTKRTILGVGYWPIYRSHIGVPPPQDCHC